MGGTVRADAPVRLRPRLRIDPGLAVALLVAGFAAWPLLTRPSLPPNEDGASHIYRTQQIMAAWRGGVGYTRWAPDFAFGLGYPLFNYYAPFTYYLGAAYGYLCCDISTGPAAGVKFVLVAASGLGAAGMYLFVRDLWGAWAGVVGAAAFALAPYNVYTNPAARSAAPEMFAVALGPAMLWAFARLRRTGALRDGILAAAAAAALLVSHTLMSFVFIGILISWLGWETASQWISARGFPARRASSLWRLSAAVAMGAGLAAFVWLPALLERGAVQFQRAFVDVSQPEAPLQFVAAPDLFGPAAWTDLGEPHVSGWKFRLGLAQWGLGLAGGLSMLRHRLHASMGTYFAALAVGLILLMARTPLTLSLWKAIPALTYLQLPWRLLGPVAVALGVLAGAATNWVGALPWGRAVFGIGVVAVCLAGAFPLLDPLPWGDYGPITPRRLLEYERAGNIGSTAQNEFLPAAVAQMPGPQESLTHSYEAGQVDKVNRAALLAGVQVNVVEHGPLHDRLQVSAADDFDLNLFTFDFPGWTAYVDGAKTPITASQPQGLITVHVPGGEREVLVRFEDTLPRRVGWLVSGLSLAAVVGLVVWQFCSGSPADASRSGYQETRDRSGGETLTWRSAGWLSAVVLAGLGLRYAADQFSPWRVDLPSPVVPEAQYQLFTPLDDHLALLAYDLPQAAARPGDQVPLTLYWKAVGPVSQDLSVFVHLIGPDGQLWGQSDKVRPLPYFPTNRWPLNRYFRDEHLAAIRADAPPGEYQLIAGLWNRSTGARLRVLDANGSPTALDGIVLPRVFVVQANP